MSRYSTLILFWFIWFWINSSLYMVIVVLPAVQISSSFSNSQAGFIMGSLFLGNAISCYPAGLISARSIRKRRVIAISIFLSLVSLALLSLSQSFEQILITAFLSGLGFGSYLSVAITLISQYYPFRKRGFIIAVHETAAPIGAALGPIYVGATLSILGWQRCIEVWLVLGLACLLFLIFSSSEKDGNSRGSNSLSDERRTLKRWTVSQNLLVLIAHICLSTTTMGLGSMLPVYMVNYFTLDVSFVAIVFGVSRMSGIVGQLIGGHLSDIFDRLKILLCVTTIAAVATAGLFLIPFGLLFIAVLLIQYVMVATYYPIVLSLVSDHTTPQERGQKLGMLFTLGRFFGTALTPIITAQFSVLLGFPLAFSYPIVVGFVGGASILVLNLKRN